ncbi:hypothetical protein [Thalassovita taeanensis]|uniref:hypothetical protein n=1 Tax=Thalassovita taeanensis TaxID=657014 RepID=UPI001114B960|nr:hypothetical protein [Thalassovita taeanensis]
MNKLSVALLMSICVLAGCNTSTFAKIEESKRIPLSSDQMTQIESTVTRDFLDPESARFRNTRAVEVSLASGDREVRVCGEVNGKNALGGYTGYSMFGGSLVNGRFQQADFFAPCEAW